VHSGSTRLALNAFLSRSPLSPLAGRGVAGEGKTLVAAEYRTLA
jgi:hypothetical protein